MKVFNWDKARKVAQQSGKPIEECPHLYCVDFPDNNNIESKQEPDSDNSLSGTAVAWAAIKGVVGRIMGTFNKK